MVMTIGGLAGANTPTLATLPMALLQIAANGKLNRF